MRRCEGRPKIKRHKDGDAIVFADVMIGSSLCSSVTDHVARYLSGSFGAFHSYRCHDGDDRRVAVSTDRL